MSNLFVTFRFPVVSKAFSDALFLLLTSSGERFLSAEQNEKLLGYITSKDWLMIDVRGANSDNKIGRIKDSL